MFWGSDAAGTRPNWICVRGTGRFPRFNNATEEREDYERERRATAELLPVMRNTFWDIEIRFASFVQVQTIMRH